MSLIVPVRRNSVDTTDVRSGRPVRGNTWANAGTLVNWTLGRGSQAVPLYYAAGETDGTLTAGKEYGYHYYFTPRFQAQDRLWTIYGRAATTRTTVAVEAPSGSDAQDVSFVNNRASNRPQTVREILAAKSEAAVETVLTLKPADENLSDIYIGCTDIPRPYLIESSLGGTDRGTNTTRFNVGQPAQREAAEGMIQAVEDHSRIGRRVSVIQWAVPADADASTDNTFARTTTSASYVDLWNLGVPILGRMKNRADVTSQLTAKFYAWVSSGSAEIRITTSNSGVATSPITVSNTSPTWQADHTFSPDCEDLTTADGRQPTAWDDLQVEMRTTGGVSLYVASVSIWED